MSCIETKPKIRKNTQKVWRPILTLPKFLIFRRKRPISKGEKAYLKKSNFRGETKMINFQFI